MLRLQAVSQVCDRLRCRLELHSASVLEQLLSFCQQLAEEKAVLLLCTLGLCLFCLGLKQIGARLLESWLKSFCVLLPLRPDH